jgi:hypothetical protein
MGHSHSSIHQLILVLGARSAKGTLKWNDKILAQKAEDKWNKHGRNNPEMHDH